MVRCVPWLLCWLHFQTSALRDSLRLVYLVFLVGDALGLLRLCLVALFLLLWVVLSSPMSSCFWLTRRRGWDSSVCPGTYWSPCSLALFPALILSRRSIGALAFLFSVLCCSRWRSCSLGSFWKPIRRFESLLDEDGVNSSYESLKVIVLFWRFSLVCSLVVACSFSTVLTCTTPPLKGEREHEVWSVMSEWVQRFRCQGHGWS